MRSELLAVLAKHSGNVRAVAREYDRKPTQVYRWMDSLDIPLKTGRGSDPHG